MFRYLLVVTIVLSACKPRSNDASSEVKGEESSEVVLPILKPAKRTDLNHIPDGFRFHLNGAEVSVSIDGKPMKHEVRVRAEAGYDADAFAQNPIRLCYNGFSIQGMHQPASGLVMSTRIANPRSTAGSDRKLVHANMQPVAPTLGARVSFEPGVVVFEIEELGDVSYDNTLVISFWDPAKNVGYIGPATVALAEKSGGEPTACDRMLTSPESSEKVLENLTMLGHNPNQKIKLREFDIDDRQAYPTNRSKALAILSHFKAEGSVTFLDLPPRRIVGKKVTDPTAKVLWD